MTPVLVPFEWNHLDDFQPGRFSRANTEALKGQRGWSGKAVSARQAGRTLGIAGFAFSDDTVHAWLLLSDELRQSPVFLCRTARQTLARILEQTGAARIQIEVDGDVPKRWATWLGFRATGKRSMEYGNGPFETGADSGVNDDTGN